MTLRLAYGIDSSTGQAIQLPLVRGNLPPLVELYPLMSGNSVVPRTALNSLHRK